MKFQYFTFVLVAPCEVRRGQLSMRLLLRLLLNRRGTCIRHTMEHD